MTKTRVFTILLLQLLAMACIIAISNYLVQFPINDWLTPAAFTYPVAFLVTDLANKIFGKNRARLVVLCGFIFGVALSLYLSEPRIAIASGSAFLISQLLDIQIFSMIRHARWWRAPVISSAFGSCIDTFLFFGIAFYATDVPWVSLAAGDLMAKAVMLLLLLPPYRWLSVIFTGDSAPLTQG